MSRTSDVIKNKNKVEKARRARRKSELVQLRNQSAFKAKLYDELKKVELILSDDKVSAIRIEVPDNVMGQFQTAIYGEDLAGYSVEQVKDKPNQFYIKRKFIAF